MSESSRRKEKGGHQGRPTGDRSGESCENNNKTTGRSMDENAMDRQQSLEVRRAYARGYNSGARWPEHKPYW